MKRTATYTRGNVVVDVVRSRSEVCLILELKINGIPSYLFDWGTMKDIAQDKAPECGCGDRAFVPNCPRYSTNMLAQYGLTDDDEEDLRAIFVEEFHIGYCKRCR